MSEWPRPCPIPGHPHDDDGFVVAPGRDDLVLELAPVGRLGGELVAAEGELVLLAAGDAVLHRQVLGGQPHVHDRLAVAAE